jgi:hypothetical protein
MKFLTNENQTIVNIICAFLSIPFLLYIIFPKLFIIPPYIASKLVSSLGIVVLFCISIFYFLFTHILFACLFVIVVYVVLTRYSNIYNNSSISFTTQTENRDAIMKEMNGPVIVTLEEEIIENNGSRQKDYEVSSFQPLSDDKLFSF